MFTVLASYRDFLTFQNFRIVLALLRRETPQRLAVTGKLKRYDRVRASRFFDVAVDLFHGSKGFVNDAVGTKRCCVLSGRPIIGQLTIKLEEKNWSMLGDVAELLGKVVRAGFSKPELAKPYEALKAAELLAKMQGYNEPDKSVHNPVHLQVDAALIEELRCGYAELAQRSAKACLPLPSGADIRSFDESDLANQLRFNPPTFPPEDFRTDTDQF
jgi:hypothetical protein